MIPAEAQAEPKLAGPGMGNGFGGAAQMAQMMIAQFDQDGDGALNPAELEVAMTAFMQRMQMRMQQRPGIEQAMGQNAATRQSQMAGRAGRAGRGGKSGTGRSGRGGRR